MNHVLLAGLGDLGSAVARRLVDAGLRVAAVRRSRTDGPVGVQVHQLDLCRPFDRASVPPAERLVICLTPSQRNAEGYRKTYVQASRRLLQAADFQRVLFVSSSAVWGQNDGAVVDDDQPPDPANWRGEMLLEAEAVVQSHCPSPVLLRLAGIYGPGRDALLRQARTAEPIRDPDAWTNRIHRDDAAALIAHLLTRPSVTGAVTGVDQVPEVRLRVLEWLAARLGAPPPRRGPGDGRGKRLRARRARQSGFECRWPDYRAGYAALLAQSGPD